VAEIERPRRPVPSRTGPIRNIRCLATPEEARHPSSEAEEEARGEQGEPGEPEAPVGTAPAGATLGYRVIEDYLRQGQESARKLAKGLAGFGAGGSLPELSERLLRDGLVWMETVAKLWASLDPPEGAPEATTAGPEVRVKLASRALAEVQVELRPGREGRELGVHPLRGTDPTAPTLGAPAMGRREDGGFELCLRIPDALAPGRYSGIIFDRDDGSVQGTVEVRVDAESETA